MSRVFLSHSSANNAEAIVLRDWMISHGWDDLFLDLDPERGLKAGERWQAALKQAAERCELVIFLVSPVWAASKWCLAEFLLAGNLNKRIFGVLVEPTPFGDLPTELTAEWQLVDLTAGVRDFEATVTLPPGDKTATVNFSSEGLNRLRIGLMQSGLDPKYFTWPPEHDPGRAPYRGLHPLESEDAGIFFGRDGPIVVGIDMLRGLNGAAPPRLVVILGASGAGKSSFMRAGLLPRLARDDQHFLPLPVIRPERTVITGETGLVASLEEALNTAGLARTRADTRAAIKAGASGLSPLLTALVDAKAPAQLTDGSETPKPPTLILPIDQAEELFLADGGEEADAFLGILRDLTANDTPALIALFTIRSDRYEPLQTAKALEGMRQQFLSLPPMPQGSYAEVIKGPAQRLEGSDRPLTIEEPLVDSLLADVEAGGAKDALPLLAFTLERLYRECGGDGDLKLDEYRHLGGVKGSIEAAVERALQVADANPAIPKDHKARLVLLRRGLVPWLAGIDPDTGAPRRRVARLSEIPAEARPLLDLLVEQHLLATDVSKETGEVTIEPAHEALLRQWGLLEGWLEEDLGDLATLEGVKRATRDWDTNGRNGEWVSHASGRLEAAEQVAVREDFAGALDPTERAYLAAARSAEDARKKAEFVALRRDRRRSRIIAWGSGTAALIMAVLGWVMYGQWQEGLKSESLFLADLARQRIDKGDAVTGMLLALEGLKDGNSSDLTQYLRPYVPAAQAALDASTQPGTWRDRVLHGHADRVWSAAFSPDGARIVTASRDDTARIWNAAAGKAMAVLEGHSDDVLSAGFSPDGARILTASADDTARVWDAADGKAMAVLEGHSDDVLSAAFSPDGARILTASADDTARVWDAADGKAMAVLEGHSDDVLSAAFSPDGARILTASADDTARVWDAADGKAMAVLEGHSDDVLSAAFSPDGARILTASADDTARVWNAADGKEIIVLNGHARKVMSAAFSPDGARILTASGDNTARVWNAADGKELAVLEGHTADVQSAGFSPDGARILTASWDATARVWNAGDGKAMAVLEGHTDLVQSAAFSPDGARIVTASWDNTAWVWNAADGKELAVLEDHTAAVHSAAFSPDGARIVTASGDDTARVWNAADGKEIIVLNGHAREVMSAAFSPDGARIVTASWDRTARVWNAADGKEIAVLEGHTAAVHSAAFSPDGARIVTASSDDTARVWNAADGKELAVLEGHTSRVQSAAFSPDGARILTASFDKTARVWNAADAKVLAVLAGHTRTLTVGARTAAFSPDGARIVTATGDNTARVWNAADGKELAVLEGHSDDVLSAAFSPDGARIVTASWDNTARVWNAADGKEIAVLEGSTVSARVAFLEGYFPGVRSAAFSSDGARILTASGDNRARVWNAADGKEIAVLEGHTARVLSAAFSPDGARIVTASWDRTARVWNAPPTQTLIDSAKEAVSRCLTPAQREQFHLARAPPRWCYDKQLWPYHDPSQTPPPRWYVQPLAYAGNWIAARFSDVRQMVAARNGT